jgi:deoxyribodipyrimidine photolyase
VERLAWWSSMLAAMWFRRDLRLADILALVEASADGEAPPSRA